MTVVDDRDTGVPYVFGVFAVKTEDEVRIDSAHVLMDTLTLARTSRRLGLSHEWAPASGSSMPLVAGSLG